MHVTACLAGQKVDVEVGEQCRTIQALKEAIVEALPKLCVEGFDVSVGGRALDNEGAVSLEEYACLDVAANTHGLSVLALREAGCEVSEEGLLAAAAEGDTPQCTLYLDAGVPIDCVDADGHTPLHHACSGWYMETARLLLDRGSTAIGENDGDGWESLHCACQYGHLGLATLLLDRGSAAIGDGFCGLLIACRWGEMEIARLLLDRGCTAIDKKSRRQGMTALHESCNYGYTEMARLLLDRGSTAIDEKNGDGKTPLHLACSAGHLETARLLLDRGCSVSVVTDKEGNSFPRETLELLSERGHDVLPDAPPTCAKRRRLSKQEDQ